MERRLAAVLVADVAGYSALIGRDEDGTIRTLKGHFSALEPIIGLHGGRVVKTLGDGFLAEFASVVDAVSCAAAMQERMAERDANQPEDRKLRFRMGIHVGDVVVDDGDILGDGVNVAARLQSLAEPGGATVSGRVYEDVVGRLNLEFEDLGLREFKNIARPLPVYALAVKGRRPERPNLALPEKPSLAVLPFTNISPDPEQEYFADGITEDIITGLSYVPWLFVIARNSSFTYKGLTVDVREVGQKLGVRYVLEGSVRRVADRLRVTGQLIDAETAGHIWAARYDGAMEDVFDLQDRITEEVVNAIAPEIRSAEIARVSRKRPESLDAYDHYLRALAAVNRARLDEAEICLNEAIARAPAYAKAKALKAWCGTLAAWAGRRQNLPELDRRGALVEEVLDALDCDPEDEAYAGYTIAFSGRDYARGLRLVERATERCPSFAWAWTSSAMLHAYRGESAAAIERAGRALRLSPCDPMAFRTYMALCFAHLSARNYDQVLNYADRGLELNPRALLLLRFKIVALAQLGRLEEARVAASQHMAQAPSYRIKTFMDPPWHLNADAIHVPTMEGLRLAGIPE